MHPLTRSSTELTFWLFMLNQGPGKGQWFSSLEYKVWFFGTLRPLRRGAFISDGINHPGSFVSGLGLPLTALVAKNNIVIVILSIRSLDRS